MSGTFSKIFPICGSAQIKERKEKVINLRQESANSVPCGQDSAVEELMILVQIRVLE